jgi:S-formylglutathione hydrolase FrmB
MRPWPEDVGPPWSRPLAGRWELGTIDAPSLEGNPLGDPARRPVWVYVPPGGAGEALPTVYLLRGHTGQLDMWANRRAFAPTFLEQVDGLFAAGEVPPALVVLVDGWTSWGGAQYLDTPAIGRYSTYLCEDVVAWVDARYPTAPTAGRRGIAGHSSGGYGALVNALRRPDVWGGVASHAGDALFEACYLPEFPVVARTLAGSYEGSWDAWWADVGERGLLTRDSDFALLNLWCMAACYSASPEGDVDLPLHPDGRLRPEVWERWLAWDPVRMIHRHAAAVASWRAAWIDGGTADEVFLDLGARALATALRAAGMGNDRLRFELHTGRHGNQEGRFLLSLRFLVERLRP